MRKMRRTRFTDLIGCRLPLQLAVLGGVGTAELAMAVAKAGGLGMAPWQVELPASAEGVMGKGFLLPYVTSADMVAPAMRGERVAEFYWGEPSAEFVEAGHRAGALVSWQVGSPAEAKAAADAGCDIVVIQGIEAGGHVRGREPLDRLLPEVLAAVQVPVVAAGGVGSAERVKELIDAGADAVRVGTRFVATPECDAHPDYIEALVAATAADTVVTTHFDDGGGWPAPVRVLGASLKGSAAAGNRRTVPPTRGAEEPLAMPCYAGMSVDFVTEIKPAAAVVAELVSLLG
jgi:nitronate monooxygenase